MRACSFQARREQRESATGGAVHGGRPPPCPQRPARAATSPIPPTCGRLREARCSSDAAARQQPNGAETAKTAHDRDPADVLARPRRGVEAQKTRRARRASGSLIDLFPARADLAMARHAWSDGPGGSGWRATLCKALAQRLDHPSAHDCSHTLLRRGRYQAALDVLSLHRTRFRRALWPCSAPRRGRRPSAPPGRAPRAGTRESLPASRELTLARSFAAFSQRNRRQRRRLLTMAGAARHLRPARVGRRLYADITTGYARVATSTAPDAPIYVLQAPLRAWTDGLRHGKPTSEHDAGHAALCRAPLVIMQTRPSSAFHATGAAERAVCRCCGPCTARAA